MSGTLAPRVVVVSRRTELEELLQRHGTHAATAYFLRQRGQDVSVAQQRHAAQQAALSEVGSAIPSDWRRGRVDRDDLARFLFAPEDIVVTVGQDGLVANVAKYLAGQPVVGVNPDPQRNPGVLARWSPQQLAAALPLIQAGGATVLDRVMVTAVLDDGQQLSGLNEIYIGHVTHQSARYLLTTPDGRERHSSSGVVVGTGTGATGWCASIANMRDLTELLPRPQEGVLCWFAREAWPSPATGVSLTAGRLDAGDQLTVVSESERLVAFADGVESDRLVLTWGQQVTVTAAPNRLSLVTPGS